MRRRRRSRRRMRMRVRVRKHPQREVDRGNKPKGESGLFVLWYTWNGDIHKQSNRLKR